ncbi:protein DMP6-like [Cynara cardunculus var. scolymus]|uniref:DUF679 domain membrane protein 2 n=1 Tax=Cynara cardunculus var. scolymus TaxID=59895 RepID=A0A118K2F4_CYNCS|nr:protein DMP6-like [Cynara cardunculus var. scolymus]KVI04288.1 Protein of unknown function DUF679 [Cynara cardunculus var. scolymus]
MNVLIGTTTTTLNDEPKQPLLEEKPTKTVALRKAFKLTAHLANLLPTGSVLVFQILSPIFTHEGKCRTQVSRTLTSTLLSLCAISCFFLCFTDSFRDSAGKVRYGMATFSGLWVIDGLAKVPPEKVCEYKVKVIDVFHGVLSVTVFVVIAIFDKNVVNCFYPEPSEEMAELLWMLPIGVGVLCSLLFAAFPTTRHGIGFPLSKK